MRSICLLRAEVPSNSVGHGVILNLLGNLEMVLSQGAIANGLEFAFTLLERLLSRGSGNQNPVPVPGWLVLRRRPEFFF
jgi:hypothetical protein